MTKLKDVEFHNYSDIIAVHSTFTDAFVIFQAAQAGATQELF